MAWEQGDANVERPLVQVPGEVCQRLRCVAETVQEKNPPLVAGAQIKLPGDPVTLRDMRNRGARL